MIKQKYGHNFRKETIIVYLEQDDIRLGSYTTVNTAWIEDYAGENLSWLPKWMLIA